MKKIIAYIYQPKFKGNEFWVACDHQMGKTTNYIVVCCSPAYNGAYMWEMGTEIGQVINNGKVCYRVPIERCTKVKELEEIKNKDIVRKIKYYQKKWINGQVTNNEHVYDKKPEWML